MYDKTKASVFNRGVPPDSFLDALVAFGKSAPDSIFSQNTNYDIYSVIGNALGALPDFLTRRAALLEAARVHAGFESSWNWTEGVDHTNQTSLSNITGQETGVFQVSFDSTELDQGTRQLDACLNFYGVSITPEAFIVAMKSNHALAVEYYARLVRFSIRWAGPLLPIHGGRAAIVPYLSLPAMIEFKTLITP
jgi:hypothetical protein